jgi:hypothetical protein
VCQSIWCVCIQFCVHKEVSKIHQYTRCTFPTQETRTAVTYSLHGTEGGLEHKRQEQIGSDWEENGEKNNKYPCDLQLLLVFFFPPWRNSPLEGQGLLIIQASRSHSDTPHSVGLLWTSDKPDAATSTWQYTNTHKRQTPMSPAGFEPAIPASDRPQTQVLGRAATGSGWSLILGS